MLRGIHRNWKQPIYFQYVHGAVKSMQLVKTLKDIIMKMFEIGFVIVGTICDQGTNNVSAINYLIKETQSKYTRRGLTLYDNTFEVNKYKIVPLYDPPHLMKGVRNNLISKNIYYTTNNVEKVAKWQDIYTAWQLDNCSCELRIMPKLTEQHVNKNLLKKMKVSVCTQIFSHTVSSGINLMAKSGTF